MSFSQGDEQLVILEAVSGLGCGRVLDIGAADGVCLSNSRQLILDGWSGVLIEPSPSAFLKLFELYGHEERVTLINAAVGMSWSISQFFYTEDLVSTFSQRHYAKWSRSAAYLGSFLVPSVPIDEILERFGAFDVVSIDIEDGSANLMPLLLAYAKPAPKVICVEHDEHAQELVSMAAGHGYRNVLLNAENLVLAR